MADTENDFIDNLSGYSKLCPADELTERKGRRFVVGETEIALFKINGLIFALNNICPHLHASIMHDGFIEDECVVCPSHGWEFNLSDGKRKSGGKGIDSYDVKISDGFVYVKVYEKKFCW